MENQPLVLILARSAQLRNSLGVLIASCARVKHIHQEEDIRSIDRLEAFKAPALVVLAVEPHESAGDVLAPVKSAWPQTPVIALVDSERAIPQAQSAGADAVLVKGILASSLLKVVEDLLTP